MRYAIAVLVAALALPLPVSAQLITGGGGGGGGGGGAFPQGNVGSIQRKLNDTTFEGVDVLEASQLPFTPSAAGGTVFCSVSGALVTGNAIVSDASGNCIDSGTTPGAVAPAGIGTELQRKNGGNFDDVLGSSTNDTLGSVGLKVNPGATVTAVTCDAGTEGQETHVSGLVSWDGGDITTGGNLSGRAICVKTGAATYGWKVQQNTTAVSTTVTLGVGLAEAASAGTYNTGTQTITNASTLVLQRFPQTKAGAYSVLTTDGGKLLIQTTDAGRFTLPAAGTAGRNFSFGGNGSATYLLQTAGGTMYGCGSTVNSGSDMTILANEDVQLFDDGTNYKCIRSGAPLLSYDFIWGPGLTARDFGISHIRKGLTIVDIRCTPDTVVGGVATLDVYKTTSPNAISAGTKLNTTACDGNTGAATVQDMAITVSALASGDRIGAKLTGAGWTAANNGAGMLSITVR